MTQTNQDCVICGSSLSARLRSFDDGPTYMQYKIIDVTDPQQDSPNVQIDKVWCPNCKIVYLHEPELQ